MIAEMPEVGRSTLRNYRIFKDLAEAMRAAALGTLTPCSFFGHLRMELIENKHHRRCERRPGFPKRPTARNCHRVTKTGYSLNSPSSIFAKRRAWISNRRR